MKIEQIDTRTGTNNSYEFSHGNTLPYTGVPFGMNYFAVQTSSNNGSWFFSPTAHKFCGIRLTHQPSPWIGDFQYLTFAALSHTPSLENNNDISGSYDPIKATFQPHYLKLTDLRYSVITELVPTDYGAIASYQFQNHSNQIVFNIPGKADFTIDHNKLSLKIKNGRSTDLPEFQEFIIMDFSSDILNVESKIISDTTEQTQLLIDFGAVKTLTQKLATSFISEEQALINLNRINANSLDDTRISSAALWQKYFDLIKIEDTNKAHIKMFFQCMYRLFLFPQRAYELDSNNKPIHYDLYNKTVKNGFLYMNNGFWDTSRTVYPLFSILIPEELQQMLQGFYNSYLESGYLPKWLAPDERGMMPGTLIDSVIADSAAKGLLTEQQVNDFLEAMITTSSHPSNDQRFGRTGIDDYEKYGYLPYDNHNESVNNSLDYNFSDFCISQVAMQAGKEKTAKKFRQKSLNYRHLFDPDNGLMRAKNKNGKFKPDFSSISWGTDYTEGSAWQNSFSVFHDILGLQKLYGNKKNLSQTLVDLCNQSPGYQVGGYQTEIHEMTEMRILNFGQLAISNQPSFHIPYLFMYTELPQYTSLLIKQLMNKFNISFDGYPGDEDNGSMSAWYIFSALGFYPVCPGTNQYILGIPMFDRVDISNSKKHLTTIITENNTPQNNFVKQVKLNGNNYHKRYLTHENLLNDSTITRTLSVLPPANLNKINESDLPFSLTTD